MTLALKIRCFLKTTAKKFWIRPRGREAEKSDVLRKEEEEEGGEGWGVRGGCACDKKSEFLGLEWLKRCRSAGNFNDGES